MLTVLYVILYLIAINSGWLIQTALLIWILNILRSQR